MAEVGYNQGVPDANPQTQAPNDEQNIQGKVGAGLQQLGAGASKAGDFFGQVAADDQTNAVLSGASKIMYGDPSKTTIGPDGQPVQDTGYLGLKGAAALRARPQVEQQLDQLISGARDNLGNANEQLQFDSFTRRYRTSLSEQVGSHADAEQNTWFSQVFTDSVNVAQDGVANDPLNPVAVARGAADTTNALIKQAVINGADKNNPNDPLIQNALLKGRQLTLKTQVQAIGATDPAQALSILTKNRALAGQDFEPLYDAFSEKADQQTGTNAGTSLATGHAAQAAADFAASPANPAQPVYQQATTQIPGGMSPQGLARTVQVESGGKDVTNASGHVGYGQFSDATWRTYGAGGDPHNFNDSVAAIQRYAAANAKYLLPILGRGPTDAELYLAHQQGPSGAARLLTNPNAPAATIVGAQAVLQNGGTLGMTAGEYTAMWTHKFNGTTPANINVPAGPRSEMGVSPAGGPAGPQSTPAGGIPPSPDAVAATGVPAAPGAIPLAPDLSAAAPTTPATPQAAAYQQIMNSGMTPRAKQYAIEAYNRQASALAIAADQSATQIRQANDKAMNTYTTQILQGDFPQLQAVASDPNLTAEGKDAINSLMLKHANDSWAGATAAYGPSFHKRMGQVIAPLGDPSRLSDPTQIYALAAKPDGGLSLAGADYLVGMMGRVTKSVDDSETTQALKSLMDGQKSKMSFQQEGDIQGPKDPQGEQLFNNRFVPRVMGAYDQWIKAGKDPWQFLTQDNFDKLAQGLRSPREMAMAKLEAQSGVTPDNLNLPPPPAGIDPDGWKAVLAIPVAAGKDKQAAWPIGNWQAAVRGLAQQPTAHRIEQFNRFFAGAPFSAQDVLDSLGVQAHGMSPDERKAGKATETAVPLTNHLPQPINTLIGNFVVP